jgi:hypothetical protein
MVNVFEAYKILNFFTSMETVDYSSRLCYGVIKLPCSFSNYRLALRNVEFFVIKGCSPHVEPSNLQGHSCRLFEAD